MRSRPAVPAFLVPAAILLQSAVPALHAQDPPRASMTGTVVVAGSEGVPLEDAKVWIVDTPIHTETDERGRFVLGDVPSGPITVRVDHPGYSTLVDEVTTDPMEILHLRMELIPLGRMFGAIRALTGEGGEEAVAGHAGSDIPLDRADGSRTAADLLESGVPGVEVRREGGPGGRGQILIRGVSSISLSNEPAIYVDGVPVGTAGSSPVLRVLEEIPAGDVVRIRVLRGPSAPSAYANSANGVILIETRKGPGG